MSLCEDAEPEPRPELLVIKMEPITSDEEEERKPEEAVPRTPPPEHGLSPLRLLTVEVKGEPISEEYLSQRHTSEETNGFTSETPAPPSPATAPPQPNPGRNECQICRKLLATPSTLQRHLLNHSRPTLSCNVCQREFLRQESLDKHLKVHSKPSSYECDECHKSFSSKSNLHQHKKTHLPPTALPFYCTTCERGFPVQCLYKKHIEEKKCVKKEDLICVQCDLKFEREFQFKCHMKNHDVNRSYRCNTCDMSFACKSTLTRHVLVHKGRPYKCQYCDKTFTSFGLIKPHMRIHTGEQPFECSICSKKFSHKQNMERHELRHNKVKKTKCDICQKVFPRESRLKYHMRTHLVNKLPFRCPICFKCYSHRQNIQRHYANKHPNEKYESDQTDAGVAKIIWDALQKQEKEEEKDREDSVGDKNSSSDDETLWELKERNGEDTYILP